MELNADFTQRAVAHAATLDWIPSPIAGVERRLLDRIGGEVAQATSIVRYAPQSHFSRHTHGGGGEFFVLEGVFQDEHGDYPAGSYIRNPPTSAHPPRSLPGCTILVKLWEFDANDRTPVRIDTERRVEKRLNHGFARNQNPARANSVCLFRAGPRRRSRLHVKFYNGSQVVG